MPSSPTAYALPIGATSSRAAARRRPSTPSRRPRLAAGRLDPVHPAIGSLHVVAPTHPDTGRGTRASGSGRPAACRAALGDVRQWQVVSGTWSAAAVGRAHRALGLTVVLAFAERVALVVLLLAGRDRDLHLRAAVLEVEGQRHDGATALARLVGDLLELGPVQEQLALAPRGVVVPRAVEVLGDVDVLEVELVAREHREAVDQGGAPHPQRLHLGAGQDDACLEGVVDEVVVAGLAVARNERPPLLLRHRTVLPTLLRAGPHGAVSAPTLPRRSDRLRVGFASDAAQSHLRGLTGVPSS